MGIISLTARIIGYSIVFGSGVYVGSCMNDYKLTLGYEKVEKSIEKKSSQKKDDDLIGKIMKYVHEDKNE
jgi:hypothetical protein